MVYRLLQKIIDDLKANVEREIKIKDFLKYFKLNFKKFKNMREMIVNAEDVNIYYKQHFYILNQFVFFVFFL